MGDMYHGTARRRLDFSPTHVAFFTPDLAVAWSHAEMDAEVDGGTPRVFRVKLSVQNPIKLDTELMQDLHLPDHRDLVARLQAEGYDCAIGAYDGEVCVFNRKDIHIQEVLERPDTVNEAQETGGAAPLSEAYWATQHTEDEYFTGDFDVFIDPSRTELGKLLREFKHLRGFFDMDHVYVWQGDVLHYSVDAPGDQWIRWDGSNVYIEWNWETDTPYPVHDETEAEAWVKQNPKLRPLIRGFRLIFENR